MYKRITVLPHYCHKMSSSILQKLPASRVIKIMRQQLCKYWVDASSNLSKSWQYFACLSWKVKKHHFNSKVPLKLNFCPWAEKWELNKSTVSSCWVSGSREGLYFCQEKVYGHQTHLFSSKWANSLHPFIFMFYSWQYVSYKDKVKA